MTPLILTINVLVAGVILIGLFKSLLKVVAIAAFAVLFFYTTAHYFNVDWLAVGQEIIKEVRS